MLEKHDDKLQGAFGGYRGSWEKFKKKILQELASNTAPLSAFAELEKKADSVFGQTPTTEQPVPAIDTSKLLAHESEPIIKKRVIGKEDIDIDIDIAAMIKKLENRSIGFVKGGLFIILIRARAHFSNRVRLKRSRRV